jgi:hypothetical protein
MRQVPIIDLKHLPASERDAAWLISGQLISLDVFIKDFETAVELFAEMASNPKSALRIEKPLKFSDSDNIETRMRKMRAHSEKRKAEFLALTQEGERQMHRGRVRMMAARDGAMTIFHIGKALQAINANLKLCPTLAGQVDSKILRAACKKFSTAFPKNEALRTAVAHVAEFTQSPQQFQKITAKIGGLFLNNLEGGDEFTTTSFKGERVSYHINNKSAALLREVVQDLFSAFA